MRSTQSRSPLETVEVFKMLAGELQNADSILPLEVDIEYPIWSPFDADDAALALQQVLDADKSSP